MTNADVFQFWGFLMIVAMRALFALTLRHERRCERLREKEMEEARKYRRETRDEIKDLRLLCGQIETSVARLEGRLADPP